MLAAECDARASSTLGFCGRHAHSEMSDRAFELGDLVLVSGDLDFELRNIRKSSSR